MSGTRTRSMAAAPRDTRIIRRWERRRRRSNSAHHNESSCPAKAGHPVVARASDRAEKPRRTGSSAFADDDSRVNGVDSKKEKRPGSLPAFSLCITLYVRSLLRFGPLGRGGRPRLHQRVVVDGFALRLFVRQLALGSDVAVLFGLGEPELGRLLLVQLRPAG